jgi:predicted phosphoadenosine phosphosulfate sulfurtransferase
MAARRMKMGTNVFDTGLQRLIDLYAAGHLPVVSFSAGKDSCVVLELAIMAARATGRLPVEVVLRDEEVMVPGTYEYAERTANRPEVNFHWLVANQPIINIFNRRNPYFWVFDPQLPASDWVRTPPTWATKIDEMNIDSMTIPSRFPVEGDQRLMAVVGMRVQESMGRLYGLFSAKGHITKPNRHGVSNVWPIYDWAETDVWKAIGEMKWDYNRAYDTLRQLGVPQKFLRIAPPTLNAGGAHVLQAASKAWPKWFDKVCDRLPGVRHSVVFGESIVRPRRRLGESYEDMFNRECILNAPAEWIRERAIKASTRMLSTHAHHSTTPFPDVTPCYSCQGNMGSWKALVYATWNGDPFALKCKMLDALEPEFFRPGAGLWNGTPSFL